MTAAVAIMPRRADFRFVLALIALAGAIGLYHLATTVIVSPDGAIYVRHAQRLAGGAAPQGGTVAPGYPLMIAAAHAAGFGAAAGQAGWVMSAQAVTLLCRMLAMIPLYLLYRRFLRAGGAFIAVVLMLVLPRFAKYGADALRDWPNTLLLLVGMVVLVDCLRRASVLRAAALGLIAAASSAICTSGLALVVLGACGIAFQGAGRAGGWRRRSALLAVAVMLIAFALPAVAALAWVGSLPKNPALVLQALLGGQAVDPGRELLAARSSVADFFGQLQMKYMGGMMQIFPAFVLIGMVSRWRGPADRTERFMMIAVPAVWLAFLAGRYYFVGPDLCYRYIMPPALAGGLYAWVGVRAASLPVERRLRRLLRRPGRWTLPVRGSVILALALIALCIPRLVRPIGHDERAYLQAARWLAKNAPPDALIASFDTRIWLYSDRPRGGGQVGFDYSVRRFAGSDNQFVGPAWKVVFDEPLAARVGERVVIYECPNSRLPPPR